MERDQMGSSDKEREEQKAGQQIIPSAENQYPSPEWFRKWKETLYIPNIKACISHTYNKAMAYRNQLIEEDGTFTSNQIVNIDED
jgi:hypothetical protein